MHYKENGNVRLNMCEKDEFCEFGHMIAFDKSIITAGFNIFIFLYTFKEVLPYHKDLKDCDFELKNDEQYKEYMDDYKPMLKKLT